MTENEHNYLEKCDIGYYIKKSLSLLVTDGLTQNSYYNNNIHKLIDGDFKIINQIIWELIKIYRIPKITTVKYDSIDKIRNHMLIWVKKIINNHVEVNNLTTDWHSGVLLAYLVNSLVPGLIPECEEWENSSDPSIISFDLTFDEKCQFVMDMCTKWLDIPMLVYGSELSNINANEEYIVMLLLTYFVDIKVEPTAPICNKCSTTESIRIDFNSFNGLLIVNRMASIIIRTNKQYFACPKLIIRSDTKLIPTTCKYLPNRDIMVEFCCNEPGIYTSEFDFKGAFFIKKLSPIHIAPEIITVNIKDNMKIFQNVPFRFYIMVKKEMIKDLVVDVVAFDPTCHNKVNDIKINIKQDFTSVKFTAHDLVPHIVKIQNLSQEEITYNLYVIQEKPTPDFYLLNINLLTNIGMLINKTYKFFLYCKYGEEMKIFLNGCKKNIKTLSSKKTYATNIRQYEVSIDKNSTLKIFFYNKLVKSFLLKVVNNNIQNLAIGVLDSAYLRQPMRFLIDTRSLLCSSIDFKFYYKDNISKALDTVPEYFVFHIWEEIYLLAAIFPMIGNYSIIPVIDGTECTLSSTNITVTKLTNQQYIHKHTIGYYPVCNSCFIYKFEPSFLNLENFNQLLCLKEIKLDVNNMLQIKCINEDVTTEVSITEFSCHKYVKLISSKQGLVVVHYFTANSNNLLPIMPDVFNVMKEVVLNKQVPYAFCISTTESKAYIKCKKLDESLDFNKAVTLSKLDQGRCQFKHTFYTEGNYELSIFINDVPYTHYCISVHSHATMGFVKYVDAKYLTHLGIVKGEEIIITAKFNNLLDEDMDVKLITRHSNSQKNSYDGIIQKNKKLVNFIFITDSNIYNGMLRCFLTVKTTKIYASTISIICDKKSSERLCIYPEDELKVCYGHPFKIFVNTYNTDSPLQNIDVKCTAVFHYYIFKINNNLSSVILFLGKKANVTLKITLENHYYQEKIFHVKNCYNKIHKSIMMGIGYHEYCTYDIPIWLEQIMPYRYDILKVKRPKQVFSGLYKNENDIQNFVNENLTFKMIHTSSDYYHNVIVKYSVSSESLKANICFDKYGLYILKIKWKGENSRKFFPISYYVKQSFSIPINAPSTLYLCSPFYQQTNINIIDPKGNITEMKSKYDHNNLYYIIKFEPTLIGLHEINAIYKYNAISSGNFSVRLPTKVEYQIFKIRLIGTDNLLKNGVCKGLLYSLYIDTQCIDLTTLEIYNLCPLESAMVGKITTPSNKIIKIKANYLGNNYFELSILTEENGYHLLAIYFYKNIIPKSQIRFYSCKSDITKVSASVLNDNDNLKAVWPVQILIDLRWTLVKDIYYNISGNFIEGSHEIITLENMRIYTFIPTALGKYTLNIKVTDEYSTRTITVNMNVKQSESISYNSKYTFGILPIARSEWTYEFLSRLYFEPYSINIGSFTPSRLTVINSTVENVVSGEVSSVECHFKDKIYVKITFLPPISGLYILRIFFVEKAYTIPCFPVAFYVHPELNFTVDTNLTINVVTRNKFIKTVTLFDHDNEPFKHHCEIIYPNDSRIERNFFVNFTPYALGSYKLALINTKNKQDIVYNFNVIAATSAQIASKQIQVYNIELTKKMGFISGTPAKLIIFSAFEPNKDLELIFTAKYYEKIFTEKSLSFSGLGYYWLDVVLNDAGPVTIDFSYKNCSLPNFPLETFIISEKFMYIDIKNISEEPFYEKEAIVFLLDTRFVGCQMITVEIIGNDNCQWYIRSIADGLHYLCCYLPLSGEYFLKIKLSDGTIPLNNFHSFNIQPNDKSESTYCPYPLGYGLATFNKSYLKFNISQLFFFKVGIENLLHDIVAQCGNIFYTNILSSKIIKLSSNDLSIDRNGDIEISINADEPGLHVIIFDDWNYPLKSIPIPFYIEDYRVFLGVESNIDVVYKHDFKNNNIVVKHVDDDYNVSLTTNIFYNESVFGNNLVSFSFVPHKIGFYEIMIENGNDNQAKYIVKCVLIENVWVTAVKNDYFNYYLPITERMAKDIHSFWLTPNRTIQHLQISYLSHEYGKEQWPSLSIRGKPSSSGIYQLFVKINGKYSVKCPIKIYSLIKPEAIVGRFAFIKFPVRMPYLDDLQVFLHYLTTKKLDYKVEKTGTHDNSIENDNHQIKVYLPALFNHGIYSIHLCYKNHSLVKNKIYPIHIKRGPFKSVYVGETSQITLPCFIYRYRDTTECDFHACAVINCKTCDKCSSVSLNPTLDIQKNAIHLWFKAENPCLYVIHIYIDYVELFCSPIEVIADYNFPSVPKDNSDLAEQELYVDIRSIKDWKPLTWCYPINYQILIKNKNVYDYSLAFYKDNATIYVYFPPSIYGNRELIITTNQTPFKFISNLKSDEIFFSHMVYFINCDFVNESTIDMTFLHFHLNNVHVTSRPINSVPYTVGNIITTDHPTTYIPYVVHQNTLTCIFKMAGIYEMKTDTLTFEQEPENINMLFVVNPIVSYSRKFVGVPITIDGVETIVSNIENLHYKLQKQLFTDDQYTLYYFWPNSNTYVLEFLSNNPGDFNFNLKFIQNNYNDSCYYIYIHRNIRITPNYYKIYPYTGYVNEEVSILIDIDGLKCANDTSENYIINAYDSSHQIIETQTNFIYPQYCNVLLYPNQIGPHLVTIKNQLSKKSESYLIYVLDQHSIYNIIAFGRGLFNSYQLENNYFFIKCLDGVLDKNLLKLTCKGPSKLRFIVSECEEECQLKIDYVPKVCGQYTISIHYFGSVMLQNQFTVEVLSKKTYKQKFKLFSYKYSTFHHTKITVNRVVGSDCVQGLVCNINGGAWEPTDKITVVSKNDVTNSTTLDVKFKAIHYGDFKIKLLDTSSSKVLTDTLIKISNNGWKHMLFAALNSCKLRINGLENIRKNYENEFFLNINHCYCDYLDVEMSSDSLFSLTVQQVYPNVFKFIWIPTSDLDHILTIKHARNKSNQFILNPSFSNNDLDLIIDSYTNSVVFLVDNKSTKDNVDIVFDCNRWNSFKISAHVVIIDKIKVDITSLNSPIDYISNVIDFNSRNIYFESINYSNFTKFFNKHIIKQYHFNPKSVNKIKISIFFNNKHILSSPYTFQCAQYQSDVLEFSRTIPSLNSSPSLLTYGTGLRHPKIGINHFFIDTSNYRKSSFIIKIVSKAPNACSNTGPIVHLAKLTKNIFTCNYVIYEKGKYFIHALWESSNLSGFPIKINVTS